MNRYCTENPDHGFHGAFTVLGLDATQAFDLAAREIATATAVHGLDAASWLDTRHGRHFGDDVVHFLADGSDLPIAIHRAIDRWLSWHISAALAKRTGLPEPAIGLPYLTGLVANHAIELESQTPA